SGRAGKVRLPETQENEEGKEAQSVSRSGALPHLCHARESSRNERCLTSIAHPYVVPDSRRSRAARARRCRMSPSIADAAANHAAAVSALHAVAPIVEGCGIYREV